MSDTQRDCEHGQLARSCRICELERDLAAARADIRRLRGIIIQSYMILPLLSEPMAFADDMLTPHVRAVADEWAIRERQLDAERAENEALREALRTVALECDHTLLTHSRDVSDWHDDVGRVQQVARAALSREQEPQP